MTTREQQLMQFHDGELCGSERRAAEERLRSDPTAHAQLESWKRVGDLVRESLESRAPSAGLTDAILERVAADDALRAAPRGIRAAWGRRLAPAMGVVAMAAAALLLVRSQRPSSSESLAQSSTASRGALLAQAAPAPSASVNAAIDGPEPGVSIQSIGFGISGGAIFVVSADGSDTMVVWTLDDANDKG